MNKTPEEILSKIYTDRLFVNIRRSYKQINPSYKEAAIEAMKEYARQERDKAIDTIALAITPISEQLSHNISEMKTHADLAI